MKNYTCIIVIMCFLPLSVVAQKIKYNGLIIDMPNIAAKSVSIAVWDQRAEVVSGKRKLNFVGYARSMVGVPQPMRTLSKKPFVDDLASSITTSIRMNGVECIVIPSFIDESEQAILVKLKGSGNAKLVLIKCTTLQSEGKFDHELFFDLQISIYQKEGILLVQKSFAGQRFLGSKWGWKEYIPKGVKDLLREIFNDPEITEALNSSEVQKNIEVIDNANPKTVESAVLNSTITRGSAGAKMDSVDNIYKSDGTEIRAKVIEITTEDVKYKRADQLEGPIRSLPVSETFMIMYKDGTREVFQKNKK